jgi:uncharacterized protein (TIGR03435 family)
VTVAKGGPKLTPSSERPMELLIEGRHFSQPKGTCSVTLWREGTHLSCHAATIQQILSSAGGELRAPIADHTGLTGTYDVNLLYMPDERKMSVDIDPEEAIAPSLLQAFQGQVGLRIAKGKGRSR